VPEPADPSAPVESSQGREAPGGAPGGEATATRFDRDTAVERVGEPDGASQVYRVRIDPGWWIQRGPNGGYLAAIILRACLRAVDDPTRTPRSLTIHYASAPVEGLAEIETRVERRGRSLSTVSARLTQAGKLIAIALTAASSPRTDGFELHHAQMPESLPPEQLETDEPPRSEFGRHFELRYLPGAAPRMGADQAVVAAWIRFREARPLDYPRLATYADAFPPACFALETESSRLGGFPTVDLNVHVHTALPLPLASPDDFTLGVFRTQIGHQGYVAEDGELWSRDGVLLAQSRQLAVVMGGVSPDTSAPPRSR
jgi:acyl-CoA thioesterase